MSKAAQVLEKIAVSEAFAVEKGLNRIIKRPTIGTVSDTLQQIRNMSVSKTDTPLMNKMHEKFINLSDYERAHDHIGGGFDEVPEGTIRKTIKTTAEQSLKNLKTPIIRKEYNL